MARQPRQDDDKHGSNVPQWLVSFCDMVTLLLAFFVLLQSFAHVRDPEIFARGRDSFIRSIRQMGVPDWLIGTAPADPLRHKLVHYGSEESFDPTRERVIDADDEKIRRIFDDLRKKLQTDTGEFSYRTVRTEALALDFSDNGRELADSARRKVEILARDLGRHTVGQDVRICVQARAPQAGTTRRQWLMSARRANAVRRTMAEVLQPQVKNRRWEVLGWGVGDGSEISEVFGPVASVVVSVRRPTDR